MDLRKKLDLLGNVFLKDLIVFLLILSMVKDALLQKKDSSASKTCILRRNSKLLFQLKKTGIAKTKR